MERGVGVRSPWIEQLRRDATPRPLAADTATDVAVIGAGIAGASTAFFVLERTDLSVVLIERGQLARGATGHNAGQLTTEFERPLRSLVATYGFEMAMEAQRTIEDSWDLLDEMVQRCAARVRVDRFVGHMAMFTLDHVCVHLESSALRRRAGMFVPACLVSETAPFLADIPAEFDGLFEVVPPSRIGELIGPTDARYCAVLCEMKGCANGALLVEQVIDDLLRRFPDRFTFVDHTPVTHVALERDTAVVAAGGHTVTTSRVVLCTNGFRDHVVDNLVGDDIGLHLHHRVRGTVGYMAGYVEDTASEPRATSYIRNEVIGGAIPYAYLTRRAHDAKSGLGTLNCIGGPEDKLADIARYDPSADVPASVIHEIDDELLPIVRPRRPAGLPYDYAWHGVMGYTATGVRLIGAEPRNPVLLYNLGCNGVGFLPSIAGGDRIARLLRGEHLAPSIFDPP
ncbi:MAG TPA: FAD-binding oxidoreductase [Ilumatobacteraceae bacterium]